jgi:hypothetical protein
MLFSGIVSSLVARTITYRGEVLADSPVGYWKLDEAAGTTMNDSSGNSYDGTYNNGFTLAQSPLITKGNSVLFDGVAGTGATVDGTHIPLQIAGDVTLEAWVNLDGDIPFAQNQHIVQCSGTNSDASANDNFLYSMAIDDLTGAMYIFTESGLGVNQTVSSTHLITNGTHHIVIVRDATAKTVTFFDNGVEYDTIVYATNADGGSLAKIRIADSAGAGETDGVVDEVAVYDSQLTNARILAHYNAGVEFPTADVSLLLPLDGLDAATTTIDESNYAHTITFNGNAQLDTAQFKNGTSSVLLDGTGDFLSIPDDTTFAFGSGNWTVECHVRFNGDPGTAQMAFVTKWEESGDAREWFFGLRNNELVAFYSENGVTAFGFLSETWNPVGDQWYHIAFCRDNDTTDAARVFVDGVQIGTDDTTIDGITFADDTAGVRVGSFESSPFDYMDGWIDNVQITKGVCKYTSDFVPPA